MNKAKSKFNHIWLFLPCHNEAENLASLVKEILKLKINKLQIAVIDDNSTDETGKIADELCQKYPATIAVLHRTLPRGRALAGKDAFIFCLNKGADVIIEMDADFSHDPRYIPLMLEQLARPGVVVVLGSRFLPGGSDSDRSAFRTLISRFSGVIFRLILGIRLTDMGSGFKAYKRKALQSINPRQLFSQKGLAISMESVFRILKNNYCVKEIPIIFKDRRAGKSKLSWKDFFEPVVICFKLVWQLGRY